MRDFGEVLDYLNKNRYNGSIDRFDPTDEDEALMFKIFGEGPKSITNEVFTEKIIGYCDFIPTDSELQNIKDIIKNVNRTELDGIRYYYLNNLKDFINDSPTFLNYVNSDLENLINMEKFDEHQMETKLDEAFFVGIKDFVFPNWIQPNADDLCRNYPRTTCLMSD